MVHIEEKSLVLVVLENNTEARKVKVSLKCKMLDFFHLLESNSIKLYDISFSFIY